MPIYRKNRHRRGGVLFGCLVALGVVVLLLVIGGVIVAMNWRSWGAAVMEQGMTQIIDKADLSQADADAMKGEVTELMQDFEDKKVSFEDLAKVLGELAESPVLPAASIMLVDMQYIQGSDLSDEDKAEGSTQFSRFIRGLFSEDISKTKIDDVTEPIAYKGGPGEALRINANNLNLELKKPEDVTPEELKAFLANCKSQADAAGIPPERYSIDMAAEFAAAIDRAMGRAPELPEAEPETGGTETEAETDETETTPPEDDAGEG